jgi:hypothetical protein
MPVAWSTRAIVAPAIGPPMSTSPTTVTSVSSPWSTAVVESPIARPEDSSVADSSAISPAFSGRRPSTIEVAGSSGTDRNAMLGAWVLSTAVPSAPTSTSDPWTSGIACATPSTAATWSTRSTGTGTRVAAAPSDMVASEPDSSAPRT